MVGNVKNTASQNIGFSGMFGTLEPLRNFLFSNTNKKNLIFSNFVLVFVGPEAVGAGFHFQPSNLFIKIVSLFIFIEMEVKKPFSIISIILLLNLGKGSKKNRDLSIFG